LKYYYVNEPGDARVSPISDELQLALDRVIKSIIQVTELAPLKVNLSGVRYSYSLWRYWMTREEESDFAATLGNNQVTILIIIENQGISSICYLMHVLWFSTLIYRGSILYKYFTILYTLDKDSSYKTNY